MTEVAKVFKSALIKWKLNKVRESCLSPENNYHNKYTSCSGKKIEENWKAHLKHHL